MLLQVAGRLRSEDLATFRAWVPFLEQAQWVTGRMIMNDRLKPQSEALDDLVKGLLPRFPDQGELNLVRIALFFMSDWERMEVSSIEQVFNLLGVKFPNARIEALLLDSGAERVVDLVLVVG
jgi:hypothetical protein